MTLPTPDERQREVLYLPPSGHTVVLGTAGSGKTVLAVLRAAYLADRRLSHAGSTLLLTFNTTLERYLEHLGVGAVENVTIEHFHKFARGYLRSAGRNLNRTICQGWALDRILAEARREVAAHRAPDPVFNRSASFWRDEISWISANETTSEESYWAAERVGRAGVRLTRPQRDLVFEVFEKYRALRRREGYEFDWDDIATAVRVQADVDSSERRYRHIVIDEGQDFSPAMIRALAAYLPSGGSLTFFGDYVQQIYGQRMSWRSAGLHVAGGRTWLFEENYRNSRQIARFALAISQLPAFAGVPDLVEPRTPRADGPLPVVVRFSSREDETSFVARQAEERGETESVAILSRTHQLNRIVSRKLSQGATILDKRLRAWVAGPRVWYGAVHGAKGLEFDTVIVPFCDSDVYPEGDDVRAFGRDEALARAARLLYVAATRARTNLILSYTDDPSPIIPATEVASWV